MSNPPPGPDEEAYIDVVRGKYPRGFMLFDVGASVGNYTDMVRKRCSPNLCAHLFEPRSAAYDALIVKYRSDPNTTVNNMAVGPVNGSATLMLGDNLEHSHIALTPMEGRNEEVDVIALDSYLGQTVLEHHNVFLKIDTEGYEMEVLQGAQLTIETVARAVQFEYGGTWLRRPWKLAEVQDLLPRFKIFEYSDGRVTQLRDFKDHYQYSNFLALRQ